MKKRILAMAVTLCMVLTLLFSFAACGSGTVPASTEGAAGSSSISDMTEPEENAESEISSAAPAESAAVEVPDAPAESPIEETAPFETITVADNDQCLVQITGIDPDNMWGYTLKVYLENRSADKTYMFSANSAAVNGVQTDPLFAVEVAAGKKSNEEINFLDSELEDNGIETFTDIELSFRVHDSDDWSAENVAEETVHVYPYGEDKAERFVRESQAADTVIVDNDDISVIVTGYEMDDIWGYTAKLYLVNKTDRELTFSVDEASVNGFMADPFWAASVGAGKVAFSSMSWSDSTLEENGITTVEEIEMQFRAHDANDWMADDIFNETVTLTP